MNLGWNTNMNNSFYSIIKIDESFKKVFEQFGLPLNRTIKEGFESLAKIIIGQQISTSVAKSLIDKLKKDGMLNEKEMSEASICLLYTSPSPRDGLLSRMPSSA